MRLDPVARLLAGVVAAEDLAPKELDLTAYAGQTLRLRFNFVLGESNFFIDTQYGWHVDDIALVNDDWGDLLTTEATSHTVGGQPDGVACYRVFTSYDLSGQPTPSRFSTVVPATVALDINQLPIAVAGSDRLVVFQETALFPWMTTLANVAYGPIVQRQRARSEINADALGLYSAGYRTKLTGT